ncbi:MAG TPA: hypothetical protein VD929_08720 [Caulobacteraceae bacterium]|nr:hypothetical protein [Caulobacteraceae bacterium]
MSERRTQVSDLLDQGLSHRDVAARLGCSRQNVSELARAERVERWRQAYLGRWAADIHAQAALTPRLATALMDTEGAPADFDALLAQDDAVLAAIGGERFAKAIRWIRARRPPPKRLQP